MRTMTAPRIRSMEARRDCEATGAEAAGENDALMGPNMRHAWKTSKLAMACPELSATVRRPPLVQVGLADTSGLCRHLAGQVEPLARREHGPPSGHAGRERLEPKRRQVDVDVDPFHPAPHAVDLVPKPRATGAAKEVLPPHPVGFRPGPLLHRRKVFPVPPHAEMQREETIDDVVLEVQQPVGTPGAGLVDLRAQAQQRLDARQRADAHAEIDHYQVGKGAEVYRA